LKVNEVQGRTGWRRKGVIGVWENQWRRVKEAGKLDSEYHCRDWIVEKRNLGRRQ